MNSRLLLGVIFWISVFSLWGFALYNVSTRSVIETDIIALLPEDENSTLVRHAQKKTVEHFQRNIVMLVGHENAKISVKSANSVREKLQETDLFSKIETRIDVKEAQQMLALYRAHSATLLTSHQHQMLKNNDMPAIRKAAIAKIYGGFSEVGEGVLTQDPLMLSGDAITEIISKNTGEYLLVDDVPTVKNGIMTYALIRIELGQNPFSLTYQKQVLNALDAAQSKLPDISFIRSGLIFHAINGANQATDEIGMMGTLSLVGVFLLLTLTFRSVRPFFFSAMAIIGGGVCGFSACLLFFEKVHLLTLVFGTSLVGVSIDYTLHYFAHKYESEDWNALDALGHIFSGISLGLITSIIGFLSLCLTPFPSLQQMAIFSVAGLVFVYGVVVFVYPYLFKTFLRKPSHLPHTFSITVLKWWQQRSPKNIVRMIFILVMVMVALLPFMKGHDDVRAMQALSPRLIQNDILVGKLLGAPIATQFFIVSGLDNDDLLNNIQKFTMALDASGAVGRYQSLVDYIAPENTQMGNVKVVTDFLMHHENDLRHLFEELSMPEGTYDAYLDFLHGQKPLPFLSLFNVTHKSPAAMFYGGAFNGEYIGFITLRDVKVTDKLVALAHDFPNVVFVDKVASITEVFDHYRVMAGRLLILAYILIFAFLCSFYSARQSALIISPSVVASLMTIIVLCLVGGSYSLFHMLALFLVMGIGIDYGLFLAESQRKGRESTGAMSAITLSATTTLLSFGLLSSSATAALHDFGVAIVMGIIVTFILSPIVLVKSRR